MIKESFRHEFLDDLKELVPSIYNTIEDKKHVNGKQKQRLLNSVLDLKSLYFEDDSKESVIWEISSSVKDKDNYYKLKVQYYNICKFLKKYN